MHPKTLASLLKSFVWLDSARSPVFLFCCLVAAALPLAVQAQPAAPTGLRVIPGDGSAVLRWSNPSDSAITSYQVRSGTGSGPSFGAWTAVSGSGAGTVEARVSRLSNGVRHAFEVRALSSSGNGAAARVWATLAVSPRAPIYIRDHNLRKALETALGKSAGGTITQGDMATLNELRTDDRGISQLSGLEYAVNLQTLELQDKRITDISPLSNLTALTQLWLRNNRITDISALSNLTALRTLSIRDNQVSDISALAGLTALTNVSVAANNIRDISPLSGLTALTELWLEENDITDVSPLSGLTALTSLTMRYNRISDISALSGLTALTTLSLLGNRITDISPLSGLTALTDLRLGFNRITDLSPLSTLTNLRQLGIHDNGTLSDLSPLSTLTGLLVLNAANNNISDISALSGLPYLYALVVDGNKITDLSPLTNLSILWGLFADNNNISDLSPLSTRTSLNRIWLSGNAITNLSPLSGLTSVWELRLLNNSIVDLSPLSNLNALIHLRLSGNSISGLAALAGLTALQTLSLSGNELSDIAPLVANSGLGAGDQLWLHDIVLSTEPISSQVRTLRSRGVTVHCCRLPPANELPEVTGKVADFSLDLGEEARVAVSGYFSDPESGKLSYSASSSLPSVAAVSVGAGGLITVAGIGAGVAEITVSATDPGGLTAGFSFMVTVGNPASIEPALASAPEGGVAELTVVLSRPLDADAAFAYAVGVDDDPATADADAGDHGDAAGTLSIPAGQTSAVISIPITDDAEIEPAREVFTVTLEALGEVAVGSGTAVVQIDEGVCDRTPAVRDALRRDRECQSLSVGDLARRGYLGLHRRGIESLRARDFLGLPRLRVLHLHGNRLSALPSRLFAGLGALSSVRLDGNRLASLPPGLLAEAPLLSRLNLSGNRLSSLSEGFFKDLSGLSELDLSGNPGAPFRLSVQLVRTDAEDFAPGPATVVARIAEGAPFPVSVELLAENVAPSPPLPSVTLPAGGTDGAPFRVSAAGPGQARLSLAGDPPVPTAMCGDADDGLYPCFQGLSVRAGPALLLFKPPPKAADQVPAPALTANGDHSSLALAALFVPAEPGDALTYRAESDRLDLVTVRIVGGALLLEANDGGDEGMATVRVTATDSDGQSASLDIEVRVEWVPRGLRSWHLEWMRGQQEATE